MAHRIRTYSILSILLFLIACGSGDSGCGDTDIVNPTPDGDTDDGALTLVMDVYRCGTQFRAVRSDWHINPIFVGEGGIVLTISVHSGRLAPIFTGIANNLNDAMVDEHSFDILGEGLAPDEPGIYHTRGFDDTSWWIVPHPARGGFTDGTREVAVTNLGEVVKYEADGRNIAFETPGEASLYGVINTLDYVTAVGVAGGIYRNENPGDFSSWLDESIENGPDFRAIAWKEAPNTLGHIAYAVGGREIWERSDGTWERIYENAPGDLYGIGRFSDRNDFWIAGTNGTIVYYDGSSWVVTDVGEGANFRSIGIFGKYACGDDGVVYHSPIGNNWSDLGYSNIHPWTDIDGLSSDEVYAANADSLMQWDGNAWGGLASVGNYELISIAAAASDRIWVVARDAGGFDNFVWLWNGSIFQFGHQSSMDRFNSIWCDDTGDTVMVATDNGYVHRWPPGSWDWLEADPQGRDLYDLWGTSAHDVFAVGADGLIVHYDGNSWTAMASGVPDTLRAISRTIAVGDNGAVTRFDGSAWRAENAGVSAHLNAVCYINANEIWAVGDGGVVIRYNGSEWIKYERALYTVDLISVWGYATDDVWFGGEQGYLLKFVP